MGLLNTIKTPADVRKLSQTELNALAAEMRCAIFEAVSTNGGHLASNLGVVELTHRPSLRLRLRPLSRRPRPAAVRRRPPVLPAQDADRPGAAVSTSCARRARSAASRRLRNRPTTCSPSATPAPRSAPPSAWRAATSMLKRNNHVVAVVGDASIVNGLAFEGLNNAGTLKRQLLIILNDNGMSISQAAGCVRSIPRARPRQHDLRRIQAVQRSDRRSTARRRRPHDRSAPGTCSGRRQARHLAGPDLRERWASNTWARSTATTCPA